MYFIEIQLKRNKFSNSKFQSQNFQILQGTVSYLFFQKIRYHFHIFNDLITQKPVEYFLPTVCQLNTKFINEWFLLTEVSFPFWGFLPNFLRTTFLPDMRFSQKAQQQYAPFLTHLKQHFMVQFFTKLQKLHFRAILGTFCPNLGKQDFFPKIGLCQVLSYIIP